MIIVFSQLLELRVVSNQVLFVLHTYVQRRLPSSYSMQWKELKWNLSISALKCGENQHFVPANTVCPRFCGSGAVEESCEPTDMCVCDEGRVWGWTPEVNLECMLPSECP